ncbi:MAG: methyl-accepting chemotaxis protein [Pseudomonadota bacterium]
MSYVYYSEYKKSQIARAMDLSATMADNAKDGLETWLSDVSRRVEAYATSPTTELTLTRFSGALVSERNGAQLRDIRRSYIDDNPFPAGQRHRLTAQNDNTVFDRIHSQFHEHFRSIVARNGYYDLFLILPNGLVAYSVEKEDDFATNVETGPYASSGLGDVFRRAMNARDGESVFVDFAPYAPSALAPASFLARKAIGQDGQTIGVVAIQLSVENMQSHLAKSSRLGPKDEIYLVGQDGTARSPARTPGLLSVLQPLADLPQVDAARVGASRFFDDVFGIRGDHVNAYVTPLSVFDATWSIVVELDRGSLYQVLDAFVWRSIVMVTIAALASVAVGYLVAASITKPLNAFASAMQGISDEDYDTHISGLDRGDEIGSLSRSLQNFRDKLIASRAASTLVAENRAQQAEVVTALGQGLKRLASGDLSVRLETEFPEEYERLRSDFNATITNMNELVHMIVENADEIHARVAEISASSDDLSHRTENQAATLEQTAAALDELTSSVREAAESASEVERVVTGARKDAEESGQVVSEAVEAMSMIRKSSNEISQIIGVIDDIAFQTNLLSLNAGVEAARAGDAGRGFAVVASEVRALAQRSSEAAKQIKSLITSSSEQVETGVGLVGRTGDALGSIIQRVGDIDTLVTGIAAGSREQSVGLGEINVGMSQLDQVTQQNAAMVEQATAVATTLKHEAATLNQTMSRFKLEDVERGISQTPEVIQFRSASTKSSHDVAPKTEEVADFGKLDPAVGGESWKDF